MNGLVDHCDCGPGDPYGIVLDGDGTVVDVISWSGTIPAEIRACYLDALATETFPCLAESEVFQVCYVCLV